MSSNQVQMKFMISKLYEWNQNLGGSEAKRALAASQFDFLQQEFLSKRYKIQKYQDTKQKEGITVKNAHIGQQIRDGITDMRDIVLKLKQEHKRLAKKKKDTPEILQRKLKIVINCESLLKDIEEREEGDRPQAKYKTTTLTDMKAKLLNQINENNALNNEKPDSDGQLSEINSQDNQQIAKWKKKDQQMEIMVDEIITGVQGIKKKVKNINQQQDVINQKTKKADKKVDDLSKRIKKDNDSLKNIIEKMKPTKCCLYIALFLLLAGLVVCIIKILI